MPHFNRSLGILLLGETISAIGTQVTGIALPLTAVVLLGASAATVGVLSAAGLAAFAVCGIAAGAAIDRSAKRRILVMTNFAAALILALVPLAFAAHLLSLALLIAVNFLASGLVAAEEIGQMSALPELVAPDALGQANGQLSAAMAVATIAGPAVAATLVALLSAPGAIAVDAISFACAAGIMLMLPKLPTMQTPPTHGETITARMSEGLRTIGTEPMLRMLIGLLVLARFLGAMCIALEAIFIVRQLGVPPDWFALAFAAGGVGALVGSLAAGAVMARVKPLSILGVALVVAATARAAMSMLHGAPMMVAIGFAACLLVTAIVGALIRVSVLSAIQTLLPPALMGRIFGTLSTLMGTAMPLGAMAGGFLGTALGVRSTLILASLGYLTLALVIAARIFGPQSAVIDVTPMPEQIE
jgi:MFS family permease